MKSLIRYKEFAANSNEYPSLKDSFSKLPYPGQLKVASYLEQGKKTYASPMRVVDAFSGDRIASEYYGMTDGEYSWNNSLSYYVRRYNLRLDPFFEQKVLGAMSNSEQ